MRTPTLPLFIVLLLAGRAVAQEPSDAEGSRGAKKVGAAGSKASVIEGYGRKWALIVGVNYVDGDDKRSPADRLVLPVLKNAEKDATSLADVLTTHYGYEKPGTDATFDKNRTVLLLGAAATHEAIQKALLKLTDKETVQENDSILVFFAGHGGRLDGATKDRGAIYPYDVMFSNGRPVVRKFGLHSDLVDVVKESLARHKLIVLDSCHSGEIFNLQARPRSETDDRSSPQLFGERTIQAIASCRATQVASDGRDGNSPFTAALLQALRQLPSREFGDKKAPIWANKLFRYMRAELSSLPNGQSPDCRCLSDDDGEFYFFPTGDFSNYTGDGADFRLLQAMVPGEHGNWWFDETPWFMPSLRRMILDELEEGRSSVHAMAISGDRLRELAEVAIAKMQKQAKGEGTELVQMRLRHLEQLLRGENRGEFQKQVEQLSAELTSLEDKLEATDAHYLAVVKHRLRRSDTADAYRKALDLYEAGPDDGQVRHRRALLALCYSDRGHYLLEIKGDAAAAAQDFERARTLFDSGAPAAFRVYVLCREADSWQRRNRWGEANRKLLEALDVANNFDSQHGLTSFVHRRRAWAFMEQWCIAEAEASFEKANDILERLARASDATSKSVEPVAGVSDRLSTEESEEDVLVRSDDFDAMIAYLHNLHGLAMARRFQGDGGDAVAKYRTLTGKIMHALARLRQGSTSARVSTGVESRLLERLVNSQERLGDCNLFGNPEQIDIKEAIDDYRRSLSMCHLFPNGGQMRISLLMKKALALSVPSPYQDTDLAQAYCREAMTLLKEFESSITGVERTLIELTPPLVTLFAGIKGQAADESQEESLESLRAAILSARNRIGQNIHRDQLELLLFASRNLVEHIPDSDRYHLAEDAETLLGLCRLALPRHIARIAGASELRQDTREYLRPFYDAVLRTKLRLRTNRVNDLLEIHWEATRGELYVKPGRKVPVLAAYVLDDKCYLFLDVPRGVSKFACVDDDIDCNTVRTACSSEMKLAPPREITRELDRIATRATDESADAAVGIECWWEDSVRAIGVNRTNVVIRRRRDGSGATELTETSKRINRDGSTDMTQPSAFPFQLPKTLRLVPRPLESASSSRTLAQDKTQEVRAEDVRPSEETPK